MAKQQQKPTSKSVTTVNRTVAGRPSAELQKMMKEDAGEGLSTDAADNLIPLVRILQPLSPQVLKKNEEYMEGAEPGLIWLKNAEDPFHDTITFQPCFFEKYWMEWIPRTKGGGLVTRYDFEDKPETAELYKDPERPRAVRWRMPDGNELVETRAYSGFVILEDGMALPYSIPLSSTGHTVGRDLMTKLNNRRLDDGSKSSLWASQVNFKTKMRSNNDGEWYVFDIVDVDWVTNKDQYNAGRALNSAFRTGEKRAEMPADDIPEGDEDSM
jgi:hypothetical protein